MFRKRYQEFAEIYRNAGRLWPKIPLYLETDAFLNFLFHEAVGTPSHKYQKPTKAPRKISSAARIKDITRQRAAFAKFVRTKPGYMEDRVQRWQTVRRLLGRRKLSQLTRPEVKKVVDAFHCLGSRAHHKTNFLNPANNDLRAIRSEWGNVLFPNGSLEAAMHRCVRALKGFGKSSVQELLGWYDPTTYPIRNLNSNAGLRYFGYHVPLR